MGDPSSLPTPQENFSTQERMTQCNISRLQSYFWAANVPTELAPNPLPEVHIGGPMRWLVLLILNFSSYPQKY